MYTTKNPLIHLSEVYIVCEIKWCRGPESNRHGDHSPQDFKSCASASSATPAFLERKTRFELATPTLARWCSTTELLPLNCYIYIIISFYRFVNSFYRILSYFFYCGIQHNPFILIALYVMPFTHKSWRHFKTFSMTCFTLLYLPVHLFTTNTSITTLFRERT